MASVCDRGVGLARGFTVIEIIAVLGVLGILAAVAVIRFSGTNSGAMAEADALKAALRYAQARAMADIYTWGITINSDSYQLVTSNTNASGSTLPGTSSATHTLPTGVTISGGTGTTVYFDWRGEPVQSAITNPATPPSPVTSNQTFTVTQSTGVVVTVVAYTGFVQ